MARGWESKAVEAQQDEAARSAAGGATPQPTPLESERFSRRRTLELARARTLADLQVATIPAHRAMLERTLAALDADLGNLATVNRAGSGQPTA